MERKLIPFFVLVLTLFFSNCGSWIRIGDLTTIGNRNIDDSKTFNLIAREVKAEASAENDALEQAIDNLTAKYQGEFLRNAKVYVKNNGKKVRVIADVWGVQNTSVNVTSEVNAKIELKTGDMVVFKMNGKFKEGRIIGMNTNSVIVEYDGNKKAELRFDEVTKVNK